jgi:multiple antibiotic resistance protein
MKDFVLAFVPIFVAVDALGVLPLFMGLTEGMAPQVRRKVVYQSMLTALTIAIGFVFLGKSIFRLMGITVFDFMAAGGAILFTIATLDLVSGRRYAGKAATIGAVPLGTPLIVGPAVLTTSLMLADVYGLIPTLTAIVVNVILAGLILLAADGLTKLLRQAGSAALSKVASLILAAIAVMMIRKGIIGIVTDLWSKSAG